MKNIGSSPSDGDEAMGILCTTVITADAALFGTFYLQGKQETGKKEKEKWGGGEEGREG